MKKSRTGRKPKKVFACKDKVRMTFDEAVKAHDRKKQDGSVTIQIYSCDYCGWYHIGNDNRKNWKNV